MIKWNGVWERRKDRYICRWILAWSKIDDIVVGCIVGYSGGGAFQLEKFVLSKDSLHLESEGHFSDHWSQPVINQSENCQDIALSFHCPEPRVS